MLKKKVNTIARRVESALQRMFIMNGGGCGKGRHLREHQRRIVPRRRCPKR